jgi:hypothetical protein
MMKHKLVRIAIGMLEALIALSAIGGGIVLLAGTYQNGVLIEAGGRGQFPLEWLRNTPFSDYTMPALILAIGVGGSSLLAAATIFIGREIGVLASVSAGLILAGYIVVEVVMLKQGVSWIESLYFGLGLVISGLAAYLWMVEHRRHHFQTRQMREESREGHIHG